MYKHQLMIWIFWISGLGFFQETLSFSTSYIPVGTTITKRRIIGGTCAPSCLHIQSESSNPIGEDMLSSSSHSIVDDITRVLMHIASCVVFAMALTFYEGYDCSFLKPLSATIRNFPPTERLVDSPPNPFHENVNDQRLNVLQIMKSSTRGMGRGAIDRSDGWYQDTYLTSRDAIRQDIQTAINLPSYNEIMLMHRTSRVPSWREDIINKEDVTAAVEKVVHALETINELKSNSVEYEWDQMLVTLQEAPLTSELQDGCSILQRAKEFLTTEIREEVGFNWGSCAWRHCGAQADAQEALSELYNSIGMFEPFECLFTLDIVERSLRDIMTVIPVEYKPDNETLLKRIGEYIPYESQNLGGDDEGDGMDSIDADYLDALEDLRSSFSFDDEE